MEKLDERKVKILKAIVSNYLETGEPVGSRTISKFSDLNLSSATIRNEMSDLEELGYIIQPHTSAGRIPTDAGYRFYVDLLMEEKEKDVSKAEEERGSLLERVDRLETLLKQVARVLASNTNYATMVTAPKFQHKQIKFIQLSQVNESQLVAVIVIDGDLVKNKLIQVDRTLSNEEVLKFNIILNTFLQGASLQDINLELMHTMKSQAVEYGDIFEHIFATIFEAIKDCEQLEIYTSGTTNILRYSELGDVSKTSALLETFEDKEELHHLIDESLASESEDGIQIYIGEEAKVEKMKDCSIVTATYEITEGAKGTIGIIGPKRMDYKKVVSTLKSLTDELDTIFHKEEKRGED